MPRRTNPRKHRRGRTAGVLVAKVAAALAGLACLACAAVAVIWSPMMRIQRVEILVDPLPAPHELRPIRQAARELLGKPLASFDASASCSIILRAPWIRAVSARRSWFRRSIRFQITMRQPVAAFRCGVYKWEVDAEGRVIRPLRKTARLPEFTAPCRQNIHPGTQITGKQVEAGLAACTLMNSVGALRGARVFVDQNAGICFNSCDRVVVVLGGPEDLPLKLAVLRAIYATQADIGRRFTRINVACPRNPAALPRDKQRPERHIPPAS